MSDVSNMTQAEADQQWKDICLEWVRIERDKELAATDYVHLPDVSVTDEFKASIVAYRQELRDFPAAWSLIYDQMAFEQKHGVTPESIKEQMPTKPEAV